MPARTPPASGTGYHHDCDCKIVPSWGETEIDGYDPDKLKAIYQQAKNAAKAAGDGSDPNTVLSWMRSESPDMFTDGSEFAPDLRIPRGSRLEQQLGEAYTRRVNRLLNKTEHKDAARLWGQIRRPIRHQRNTAPPKALTSVPPTAASTSTRHRHGRRQRTPPSAEPLSTKAATCSTGYSTRTRSHGPPTTGKLFNDVLALGRPTAYSTPHRQPPHGRRQARRPTKRHEGHRPRSRRTPAKTGPQRRRHACRP